MSSFNDTDPKRKLHQDRFDYLHLVMDTVRSAERDLSNALKAWPVGGGISWIIKTNGDLKHGVVVAHSNDRRIKVRNTETSKEYWIDCFWVRP